MEIYIRESSVNKWYFKPILEAITWEESIERKEKRFKD